METVSSCSDLVSTRQKKLGPCEANRSTCMECVFKLQLLPGHVHELQVAYAWAMHLEVEEKKGPAAKMALLRKMGLVEYAIDYATETADFEHAFSLAQAAGLPAKTADIHLKHAMHLEVAPWTCSCRRETVVKPLWPLCRCSCGCGVTHPPVATSQLENKLQKSLFPSPCLWAVQPMAGSCCFANAHSEILLAHQRIWCV